MSYSNKDFETQIKALSFKGFEFKKEVQGFSWKQRFVDRLNQIILGYKSYPGGFFLQTPFVSILLVEIEHVLRASCDKNKITQVYSQYTIQAQLGNLKNVDYQVFDTEINDDYSFALVAKEVEAIIEYGAQPFFERYNSLQNIADLLADKKPEEIVPYMQGAILLPKTVLILREAGHPQYKKKLWEFFVTLKQYADKKESYKPFLNVFIDLFSEDLKVIS